MQKLIHGIVGRAAALGLAAALAIVSNYGAMAAADQSTTDPSAVRILAFGDSLMAGYGLADPDLAFPAQLEAALRDAGHTVEVLPGSVSGDTTRGGLSRVDWSLADEPDAVIVALGANDMLRGLDPALMEENLAAIIDRFRNVGVEVLLCGLPALGNWGSEMQRAYRAVFGRLGARPDVLFHENLLAGIAGEPALNQPDGIHPNARGVDVMVANLLPDVRRLVGAAAKPAR